jgi:hypothetical protein
MYALTTIEMKEQVIGHVIPERTYASKQNAREKHQIGHALLSVKER